MYQELLRGCTRRIGGYSATAIFPSLLYSFLSGLSPENHPSSPPHLSLTTTRRRSARTHILGSRRSAPLTLNILSRYQCLISSVMQLVGLTSPPPPASSIRYSNSTPSGHCEQACIARPSSAATMCQHMKSWKHCLMRAADSYIYAHCMECNLVQFNLHVSAVHSSTGNLRMAVNLHTLL